MVDYYQRLLLLIGVASAAIGLGDGIKSTPTKPVEALTDNIFFDRFMKRLHRTEKFVNVRKLEKLPDKDRVTH